jgi:hypothetical protein
LGFLHRLFGSQSAYIALRLCEHIFRQLNTSFKKRMEDYLSQVNPSRLLPDLINMKEISENFYRNIILTLKRDDPLSDLGDLPAAIFEPYVIYQNDYVKYEKNHLNLEIGTYRKIDMKNIPATREHVTQNFPRIFLCLENSISRCIAFTGGTEGPALLKILNVF